MPKKILVVDDDKGIVDALTLILEDEGYSLKTTLKGDEVFAFTEKFKPDLILLDVLMSGHDGRVICAKLKSDVLTKNIPVIMISAHPAAESSVKQHGADDFIAKPFSAEDLFMKIDKHTSRKN